MTLQRGMAGDSEADDEINDNDGDAGMEKSAALLMRARKEQQGGDFLKAMATYVQVLQLQLQHRAAPGESSPSHQALRQMMETSKEKLQGTPVTFELSSWWLSDAVRVETTLTSSIANLPKAALGPGKITVDMLQTLAEYVVRWYTPYALDCAAVLYERILAELDGGCTSPSDPDGKRAHVVRELAKVYVEMLGRSEYGTGILPDISPAQHAVIRQGLEEIEKDSTVSDRLQFYQHLGALHILYAAKDPRCSEQAGERMLRNVHKMQARLFGLADHRSVATAQLLSRYYVERGGQDVEAAQLIQDTLQAVAVARCQPKDASGHKDGQESEEEEGEEEEGEEDAEDAKWRMVLEKWEASVARTDTMKGSSEGEFASILRKSNLQAALMQLLAPPGWVWQDSRLYLCDIAEVRFRRVVFADALDNYPVRIARRGDGLLDIRLPVATHPFYTGNPMTSMAVSDVVRSVRESHFYTQLLLVNSERTTPHIISNDGDSDGDSLHSQVSSSSWETMDSGNSPDEAAGHPKPSPLAKLDTDHALWVFPRDLDPPSAAADTRTPSYELEDLPDRPNEWLVVVCVKNFLGQTRNPSWKWRGESADNTNDDELACTVNEKRNEGCSSSSSADGMTSISVVCPHAACDELHTPKGAGWGFKYADLAQLLGVSARQQWSRGMADTGRILAIKKAMCREPVGLEEQQQQQAEQVPTILLDGFHDIDHGTHGFFNHVPGRAAWSCVKGDARGFHLVSSDWVDWAALEVTHEKLDGIEHPKLHSTNGEPIRVRGVISGSWIPDTLVGKYGMDRVFVVDAVLIRNGTDTHQSRLDFLFCREDGASFKAELTSAEKRSLIGSLNPSVFCYKNMNVWRSAFGWMNKAKKKKPAREPTVEERMMTESERREGLLAVYKQNLIKYRGDESMLTKVKMDHDVQLKEWAHWDETQRLMIESMAQVPKG